MEIIIIIMDNATCGRKKQHQAKGKRNVCPSVLG